MALGQSADAIAQLAQDLAQQLRPQLGADWQVTVAASEAQLGGGTDPLVRLPSTSLVLGRSDQSGPELQASLLAAAVPVLGRVRGDHVWLDVRTLSAGSHGVSPEALGQELLTRLRPQSA